MSAQQTKASPARFWEVDTLRGLAIVLMVFYHLMWDLNYFGVFQANMLAGPWQTFARSIATTFIFVMGVSLTLSYNRTRQKSGQSQPFKKYLWRGGKLFGWGMLITLVTYFFIGRGFVVFGILHLIGLSIILAYPFLHRPWASLLIGLLVIALGFFYVDSLISETPWFIWLGVKQIGRYMVDYYPLLPWFGMALLGIFAGSTLYPQGMPRNFAPNLAHTPPVRGLTFLGRHSLLIYLLHQPVLLATLILLGVGAI